MKNYYHISYIFLAGLLFSSCEEEMLKPSEDCFYKATVEDHTGLDGCGYLFKLESGEYLEPIIRGWCGTPPIPQDYNENALWNFNLTHGEKVLIGYQYAKSGSICMKGKPAIITCIQSFEGPLER